MWAFFDAFKGSVSLWYFYHNFQLNFYKNSWVFILSENLWTLKTKTKIGIYWHKIITHIQSSGYHAPSGFDPQFVGGNAKSTEWESDILTNQATKARFFYFCILLCKL